MSSIAFYGITKRFPGVTALSDVTFTVGPASCHAICGENGAGKSTLGRILAGLERADSGSIRLADDAHDATPDELLQHVAMVHQELAFCENLTVAENLSLGHLPSRRLFVDRDALRRRAEELLANVGAELDPGREMRYLTVAEQQLVQIAAAIGAGANAIVFDEPTSSLGERETERLYELIRNLTGRGVTVIYVSHRMAEILELCDAVTVLRDGRHVSTSPAESLDEAALVEQMIGRRLSETGRAERPAIGEERLRVEHLSRGSIVRDVSFQVSAGEIVGLAGLVGAGRSEIAEAIFGLHRHEGRILVRRQSVRIRSPRDAMAHGIGFVPEDRKRHGLVLSLSASENVTLPTIERFARWTWIRRDAERQAVGRQLERLRVRARPAMPASALSGGNQQKLVLAKWLAAGSDILMLDEPTRGVDVGAKADLHEWIEQLAASGVAVLLISSELPELLRLATRILVVRDGTITSEIGRDRATQGALLRAMAGLNGVAPSEC